MASIVPGTTPTLTFKISSDLLSTTNSVRMDVVQNNVLLFQTSDNTINTDSIVHVCTQDETYMMEEGTVSFQLHGITSGDVAWKTNIIEMAVAKSLSNTVIEQKVVDSSSTTDTTEASESSESTGGTE